MLEAQTDLERPDRPHAAAGAHTDGPQTPHSPRALSSRLPASYSTYSSDFHLIVWKFVLIHFTLVDLKNQPFEANAVWTGALRRYRSKINSYLYKYLLKQIPAEARDQTVLPTKENRLLAPLSQIDETGSLQWRADCQSHADRCLNCDSTAPT